MSLADDFDALLASPDPAKFDDVARLVDRFSARFADGDGQWMSLEAYPDSVAAGTALWDEKDRLVDSAAQADHGTIEWLDLCARAGSESQASETVAETFSQAHSV